MLKKGKMRAKNCPERSIVPEGVFTEAYLVVYSEGHHQKSNRQKREREHGHRRIREGMIGILAKMRLSGPQRKSKCRGCGHQYCL